MSEIEEDLEENIADGTYFTAARRWYSEIFHSPIAERNYYSILLVLSVIALVLSFGALISVFPLKPVVSVVIYSDDAWEEMPRITKLSNSTSEDKNVAVMRYMIGSYVINRESYSLKSYQTLFENIWTESSSDVFQKYRSEVDVSNPSSPYREFTDVMRRDIQLQSIDYSFGSQMSHATVIFMASIISVVNNKELRHTKWKADITYQYTNFELEQRTKTKNWITTFLGLTGNSGKDSGEDVVPMKFMVTDYQLKELLE